MTDFRKPNEAIKRNPWPMLIIQNMIHQCGEITYATALYMKMSYYTMNVKKAYKNILLLSHHGVNTCMKKFRWF